MIPQLPSLEDLQWARDAHERLSRPWLLGPAQIIPKDHYMQFCGPCRGLVLVPNGQSHLHIYSPDFADFGVAVG